MLPPTALHNCSDVAESIAASAGNNNYQAHQMIVEVYWIF